MKLCLHPDPCENREITVGEHKRLGLMITTVIFDRNVFTAELLSQLCKLDTASGRTYDFEGASCKFCQ
jgi:hypothetical protein